jgi:hypothetical protein
MRWRSVVGAFRTGMAVCFVVGALVCSEAAGASVAACGGSGAPAPNKSGNNMLNGAAATSACNAWIVGTAASKVLAQSQTLVERWNGTAWKVQTSPSPGVFNELYGVAAPTSGDAWAVGFDITPANTNQTLVEHWNGTAWTVQTSANPSMSFNELKGVAALSPTDAWAVGYSKNGTTYETLVEHWNGKTWKVQTSPNSSNSDNELNGVAALSPTDAWAAGYYNNGTTDRTLVQRWNGTAWKG